MLHVGVALDAGLADAGAFGGAKKAMVEGNLDMAHVSTSYVEHQNLTMRMHMRRFTRLANAFSKQVDNHAYAVALFTTYYNFVRLHGEVRVTPAMQAGVTDRLWEIGDIVALVETADAPAAKRGSYKKADRADEDRYDGAMKPYRSMHSCDPSPVSP